MTCMSPFILTLCEWAGTSLGLVGAVLLATHTRWSRFGWLAFLAANIAVAIFALGIGHHGLFVQQIGFSATSLLGIWRAGLVPIRRTKVGCSIESDRVAGESHRGAQ
jgi:hypothetical protein